MGASLNGRQLAFVNAFTGGAGNVRGNATASYVAAGYSRKGAEAGAARLLANVKVAKAVRVRQRQAAADAEITQQGYVQMCLRQATWWEEKGTRPDASNVRALEVLGKALGFLESKDTPPSRFFRAGDMTNPGSGCPVNLPPLRE